MTIELIKLPYAYDSLEPHIDALTMETHHTKHHNTYVNNLNKTIEGTEWADKDIEYIIEHLNEVPENIKTAVRNNGGGVYNHNLFFLLMGPDAKKEPEGKLLEAINSKWNNLDEFKSEFKKSATGQFGSGWAWLVLNNGELEIVSTANQDNPLTEGKNVVFGIDVWEHAYYLNYKNLRPDYVDAFWNVLDWAKVEERYDELTK